MARLKVASLFCGCGGMDLGITGGFSFLDTDYPRSAFDIVYAVDNDEYCTKIYNANFDHKCMVKDVREIIASQIPDFDVLVGPKPTTSRLQGRKGDAILRNGKNSQSKATTRIYR